jgi:CubicO group peptidase (beta-lactamase class C family)
MWQNPLAFRWNFELSLEDTMASMTRRAAIAKLVPGFALTVSSSRMAASWEPLSFLDDNIDPTMQKDLRKLAESFCENFDVPGLSVAIHRHGKPLYEQAFGEADPRTREPLQTSHLFRIASISKPITSVSILKLTQQDRLHLSDRVFGEGALLGTEYGPPKDGRVQDITVEHLLTHTAGGWPNNDSDPMFRFRELNSKDLISQTIQNVPLDSKPGTRWAYSNFGFCILGRVIEKVTNQKYSEYVQDQVLSPSGITDMRIGGNTPGERLPTEVTYYGQSGENPYNCNVARMDSHGGWLASARDLAIFAAHIDGSDMPPALLQADTIATMVAPVGAYAFDPASKVVYARGWYLRSTGTEWFHDGSLPGTTTSLVRASTGFCWSGLTNTRRQPSARITAQLNSTLREMVSLLGG